MLFRLLAATTTACCLCSTSAESSGPVAHCDVGQEGCKANVEGDESELLQTKVGGELKQQHTALGTPISHYVFKQKHAQVFAALAKLAYCGGASGTSGAAEKTCGTKGFCKDAGVRVKRKSVRTVSVSDGDSKHALSAYVSKLVSIAGVQDPLKPGCVVAIRGTWPGTNNEKRSQQTKMVPFEFGKCKTCRVHQGYQEIWKKLLPPIFYSLQSAMCTKTTPVYVTGHSMGGAVATIGMYALKTMGWNVQPSYTFHNPKVGDAAWVKSFNTVVGGSPDSATVTRITHHEDNVPTFPPNYAYTWPEAHYAHLDEVDHSAGFHHELCWGQSNCGVLKYNKLCKQSECDDHLINPLAPDVNLAVFKDPQGVCMKGKGTVAASVLPRQGQSADRQLDWMKKAVVAEDRSCVNGWQLAQDCLDDYTYKGQKIHGCTDIEASKAGTRWCSLDEVFHVRWNSCIPCGDNEAVASWGAGHMAPPDDEHVAWQYGEGWDDEEAVADGWGDEEAVADSWSSGHRRRTNWR